MSDDILSQDEVDALLKGVTSEADECYDEYEKDTVFEFNLRRFDRIIRGRWPAYEICNERFARLFRKEVFAAFDRTIEVSISPVRALSYSEFVRNLVVPTCINVTKFSSLRGEGLVIIDPNLVFLFTDHAFGGDGRFHMRVEGRDFTDAEQVIIKKLVSLIYKSYSKSFELVYEMNLKRVRMEMNTQFANIAAPSELVIVVAFNIEMGSGGGDIHICIPYSMIEPIKDIMRDGAITENVDGGARRVDINDIDVEMVAHHNIPPLTVEQVLGLKVGDEFIFNQVGNLEIDDQKLFKSKFAKDCLVIQEVYGV